MSVRYAIPPALADIPYDRHTVIEASAGTGKTYLIERRIVDLVLRGVDLDAILVVTFTEKATAELRTRVRRLLTELLHTREHTARATEPHWLIDAAARALLRRALHGFDAAPIHTIHAFCQRVLTDNAFANGRLFEQTQVDRGTAFAAAFRTALRHTLAREREPAELLAAWLEGGGNLERLEALLVACADARGRIEPRFDRGALEAELVRATAEVPSDPADATDALTRALQSRGVTARAAAKTAAACTRVVEALAAWRAHLALPRLLAAADGKELAEDLRVVTEGVDAAALAAMPDDARRLAAPALTATRCLVPLSSAIVQRFLPVVLEQLAADKRRRGQFDFDDMLELVWQSLDGPRGAALCRALRERYRHALIDEFQDTDELQWSIFRRLFVDGDGSVLCVIGDPKQAIYGFRGADVDTYLRARDELVAGGGARIALTDNHRSSPALVAAYNEVLRDDAPSPLLTGEIRYREPVRARAALTAVNARGEAVAPIALLHARADAGKLGPGELRPVIGQLIADELGALLTRPEARLRVGPAEALRPLVPGDVFVLTRSTRESVEMAERLRAVGVPCALYKQEGLFQTAEAGELLELLRAIERPHDHSSRLKAWQTAFFGVPLDVLLGGRALPDTHPLIERLLDWHQLARGQRYEALFDSIVADSGLVRRELFTREGERELTNYLHIAELLLAEARSRRLDLGELIRRLEGYVVGRTSPAVVDGNVQRLESERHAVQIMTMHKAKGLEAEVVFAFGAFGSAPVKPVRVHHRDRERIVHIGPLWDPEAHARCQAEAEQEEQRLLYVALTRAKARLYLPYVAPEHSARLTGAYAGLRRQLHRVLETAHPGFELVTGGGGDRAEPAAPAPHLADWCPAPELLTPLAPSPDVSALRAERAGPFVTSYTRMKQTEPFAFRATIDRVGADDLADGELAGGTATGLFLHDVLEHVSLPSVADAPSAEAWATRPEVAALLTAAARRHRQPPAAIAPAARVVFASLRAPVAALANAALCELTEVRRELEFVFPTSRGDGFVKGFIDLVFEHRGRLYLLDWKSDALPDYASTTLAAHVAEHYALQARLYCLAAARLLGLNDPARTEARFGGMLFCLLRGPAFHAERPDFATLEGYARELEARA